MSNKLNKILQEHDMKLMKYSIALLNEVDLSNLKELPDDNQYLTTRLSSLATSIFGINGNDVDKVNKLKPLISYIQKVANLGNNRADLDKAINIAREAVKGTGVLDPLKAGIFDNNEGAKNIVNDYINRSFSNISSNTAITDQAASAIADARTFCGVISNFFNKDLTWTQAFDELKAWAREKWDGFTNKTRQIWENISKYIYNDDGTLNTGTKVAAGAGGVAAIASLGYVLYKLFVGSSDVTPTPPSGAQLNSLSEFIRQHGVQIGVGAAAAAGILGTILYFKKWRKNKTQSIDKASLQYALKMNTVTPDQLSPEEQNKIIDLTV